MTPVSNFGKVTVSTTYVSGDTSIVLSGGHGSRLPSTFSYPLTWWNATLYSDPSDDPDREIVLVTNRVGDTLTVVRGQEGTSASNKNLSGTYKMLLSITKAMWEQVNLRALTQTHRGLELRSHTDSDLAASYVRLVHADAIVMSDGEEVADWNDVDLDLAAANGIGAIDAGTEQNSTWYEAYAMYNGTTKGLMAHRAKDYFLDEDVSTGEDATQGIRSAVDNSTVKVAQGFKVDVAGPVEFVDVKLIKVGTPTGNLYFTIEADSAGVPSNTPLATSDKLDVSKLVTAATWVRIPFRTPVSISAATQYHLVAQGDWAVSAANYVGWRMDGSAAAYANGSKALFDSDTSTWTTDTDDDLMCKVYVTENDTVLTVPSGYTYAFLGYFRNNSAGNIVPYYQLGNKVRYLTASTDTQIVNETVAAATLVDLRDFFPPESLLECYFALSGTGAAAAGFLIAPISMPGPTVSTLGTYSQILYSAATSESDLYGSGSMILGYSAFVGAGTAGADLYASGFML